MFDQTVKLDGGKYRPSMCHPKLIEACARISEYGEQKYPRNSWRKVEVIRYYDACLRHLLAVRDDLYAVDSESGMKHLWHAVWNIGAILELELSDSEDEIASQADKLRLALKGDWEDGDE